MKHLMDKNRVLFFSGVSILFLCIISHACAATYQRKVICTIPHSVPNPSTVRIESDFLHQTGNVSMWSGPRKPVANQITSPDLNNYAGSILGNFQVSQLITLTASINKGQDGYHDTLEQHITWLKQSANGSSQTTTRGNGFSSSYAVLSAAYENEIGLTIHTLPPAPSSAGITFFLDGEATYAPVEITISTNTPPTSPYYGAISGVINWGLGYQDLYQ